MFKCPVHYVVNEAHLQRLAQLIVLPFCLLLYEHLPQGCASKTAFLFLPSFPPDLARRQSIQRRRKVLIWGGEKVLTREARAKKLRSCSASSPTLAFCFSLSLLPLVFLRGTCSGPHICVAVCPLYTTLPCRARLRSMEWKAMLECL